MHKLHKGAGDLKEESRQKLRPFKECRYAKRQQRNLALNSSVLSRIVEQSGMCAGVRDNKHLIVNIHFQIFSAPNTKPVVCVCVIV